jgi:asparagine synthase (glutamine-hydrolysing)
VHRRLAIIDLSETGAQQMAGADGCQLVHNGEICNYPELREELEVRWPFRSRSDTETILAAHDAWQDAAPLHFWGMWAMRTGTRRSAACLPAATGSI